MTDDKNKGTTIIFDYNDFKKMYEAKKAKLKQEVEKQGYDFPDDPDMLSDIVAERFLEEGKRGVVPADLTIDDLVNAAKKLSQIRKYMEKHNQKNRHDLPPSTLDDIKKFAKQKQQDELCLKVLIHFEVMKMKGPLPKHKSSHDINFSEIARNIRDELGLNESKQRTIIRWVRTYLSSDSGA